MSLFSSDVRQKHQTGLKEIDADPFLSKDKISI